MQEQAVTKEQMTKYNTAAKICSKVAVAVVQKIHGGETSVKDLCVLGNNLMKRELSQVKDLKGNHNIAFPFSISLNDCVGNYVYHDSTPEYNMIKAGDIVKFELGVNVGGCIATYGDTIVIEASKDSYIKILDKLEKRVLKTIKPGEINDDVKMSVESYCADNGCFPVENTTSYQMLDGQMSTEESKYIILNHQKYYDENDNLVVNPNTCFEFEAGEIYNIYLTIINNTEDYNHKYTSKCPAHISRFNNYYMDLKLNSSKDFHRRTKSTYGTNAFSVLDLGTLDGKSKMGMRECRDKGILDDFEVLFNKQRLPVYHRKFTVIVTKDGCKKLEY